MTRATFEPRGARSTSFLAALALVATLASPGRAQEEPSLIPAEETAAAEPEPTLLDEIDDAFGSYVVAPLAAALFLDVVFWDDEVSLPFIVVWLILGATFFTLRLRFINLRGLKHAVEVTAGKYDHAAEEGEVTHFQALASALSATVGLGNIAGVAIAVSTGGPGAVFWMVVAGFLGMSSKLTECTLGQMYRVVDERGHVLGGPMRYLSEGLRTLGFGRAGEIGGKVLAIVFAVMCIGGSFGGGNMFQANQAFVQTARVIPYFEDKSWLFGILVAFLVGAVIIGGIKRIGDVAGVIVPFMCGIYVLAGICILIANASVVPEALGKIVSEAFTPQAGFGGAIGVLVTGFKRASFSNEAGIGSASIAHSAASTSEPVREGIVALLEPFIDTIIICTMTGLVVVVTGTYLNVPEGADGVVVTSNAFATVFEWFPYVLAVAVFLFAFSTMISWSYYGERCWVFLFGSRSSIVYRVAFLGFTILGAILNLDNVMTFSDLMILGMAFPNILGLFLLSGQVARALDDYWGRYQRGEMPPPPKKARGARSAP